MLDRSLIGGKMREHYEAVWGRGDAWELEASQFEQSRYAFLLEMLRGRRYARALEIGCGSGCFTRLLAGIADHVLALDIAQAAIDRARVQVADVRPGAVELRAANVMEYDPAPDGPWDLIVLTETIYSLGWLYPFFDLAYLAQQLLDAMRVGGRLLLANTYGHEKDWLLHPALIHTYRDLFRNTGYGLAREEILRGAKNDVTIEVLATLLEKQPYCLGPTILDNRHEETTGMKRQPA